MTEIAKKVEGAPPPEVEEMEERCAEITERKRIESARS